MFPFLVSALSDESVNKHPTLTATALDLLAKVICHVQEPFPSVYTTQVFPRIAKMMLYVQEDAILQNGQECLKLLVNRDFGGISSWSDGVNDGAQYIMKFILKLLDPCTSESSAIFVGELITKLIQKGGSTLETYIPNLLTAVVHRLKEAKMPSFVQTLVLIFCHLIQTQMTTVLTFLSSLTIGDKTGLEIFISKWLNIFGEIQGFYAVKLSTSALVKLYLSSDQRLQSIQLQGDLIVNNAQSIKTFNLRNTNSVCSESSARSTYSCFFPSESYEASNW